MTRRTTLQHTITAVLAAGALVASPALGRPVDRVDRFDAPSAGLDQTNGPRQDLRSPDARDAARPKVQPGQPTWPAYPRSLPAAPRALPSPAPSSPTDGGNGDDGIWLILGLGLGGTALVAGGAAGLARHSRVRAGRVAA